MVLMLYRLLWEALYPVLWMLRPLAPGRWKLRERFYFEGRHKKDAVTTWGEERVQVGEKPVQVSSDGKSIPPGAECLWFHCASLGEAKGLLGLLSLGVPGRDRLLLTAATATGVAFLREEAPRVLKMDGMENCNFGTPDGRAKGSVERGVERRVDVAVAPLDHPRVLRRFMRIHRPRALCLYELEWWPHVLLICRQKGIPVLGVSVRFGERAAKIYSRIPGTTRRLADCFTYIQTQTERDAKTLGAYWPQSPEPYVIQNRKPGVQTLEAGVDYKTVYYSRRLGGIRRACSPEWPGDFKPGRSPAEIRNDNPAAFRKTGLALVSLHHRELLLFLPYLKSLQNKSPLYILPRHLRELPRFEKSLEGLDWSFLSSGLETPIRLADKMGCVEACLRKVRACFVGGSLIPVGGHNLWEPFFLGVFSYIGPFHQNQISAVELMKTCGMLRVLNDPQALFQDLKEPLPGTQSPLPDAPERGMGYSVAQENEMDFSTKHVQILSRAQEAHARWARWLEGVSSGDAQNSGLFHSCNVTPGQPTHPRQYSRQISAE